MTKEQLLEALTNANAALTTAQRELVRVTSHVQRMESAPAGGPKIVGPLSYEPRVENGKVVKTPPPAIVPAADLVDAVEEASTVVVSEGPTPEAEVVPQAVAVPIEAYVGEVEERGALLEAHMQAGIVKPAVGRQPTVEEMHAKHFDPSQGPTGAPAPFGPTLESPVPAPAPAPAAVAPAEPTEESKAAAEQRLRDRVKEQRKHFVGTGSLFARHLSPAVMSNAKGFLRPEIGEMKQYQEDVVLLQPEKLELWPAGFYRNVDNKQQQFFIKVPGALFVLDNLPSPDREPIIYIRPAAGETSRVSLEDLTLPQLMRLRDELEGTLQNVDYTDNALLVPPAPIV